MELEALVQEKFPEPQKCRHCDKDSTMKVVESDGDRVLVGYACPGGYLSMLVLYGKELELDAATSYLHKTVGANDADVRMATRYAWDLSLKGWGPGRIMRAAYWRQNYGRGQNKDPDRIASFICKECSGIYSQPASSTGNLCPECSKA